MQISNLAIDAGPPIYYNADFRRVLEAHMDYLRKHPTTAVLTVEPDIVNRYKFDFYGLLAHYRVDPHLHWIVLRLNQFNSPTLYPVTITELMIPYLEVIDQIQQIYRTSHSIPA